MTGEPATGALDPNAAFASLDRMSPHLTAAAADAPPSPMFDLNDKPSPSMSAVTLPSAAATDSKDLKQSTAATTASASSSSASSSSSSAATAVTAVAAASTSTAQAAVAAASTSTASSTAALDAMGALGREELKRVLALSEKSSLESEYKGMLQGMYEPVLASLCVFTEYECVM